MRNKHPSPSQGSEDETRFWETIPFDRLSPQQWEALCDGCGRCCLNKIRDPSTGEHYYTKIACPRLDPKTCRCTIYSRRSRVVPDCVRLSPDNVGKLGWLPPTCAYRLLFEGKRLKSWHPLVSGDPDSPRLAGLSVGGRTVSERDVDRYRLEDYRISWIAGATKLRKPPRTRSSAPDPAKA